MKLSWKEIEPFVRKPSSKARAILIYGPDDGLMRERAAMIGKSAVADLNDPFNVSILTADTLGDDPARLQDEALSMSLMGGARLIRVEGGSDKMTVLFKDYLASPSPDNLVVVEAGELGPRSTLRLLFEKSEHAVALPCYVDDEKSAGNLIRESLSSAKFTIQPDALAWLVQNISGDRAKIRAEIEKLTLYMGYEARTVTLTDARAACGEAGDQSIDDLIQAIGGGRCEIALGAYSKLIEEGVSVVAILRALQTHFRRLHFVKGLIAEGANIDDAMKKLQPAVFFKQADAFKAQLRKWPEDRLLNFLNRISQVEAQTKQTGAPVETLCSQVVLSLSC